MILITLFIMLCQSRMTWKQMEYNRLKKESDPNKKTTTQSFTYTVPLNHFNANNMEEFDIHYFVNEDFLDKTNKKSPVFVLLGGEGPESERSLENTFVINALAERHKGLMVDIEHRFYGSSTPSLEMDKIIYCTAEQALMDFVEVINHVKETYEMTDHPVIVLGGSYSGNLAVWMRQKYPNLVDGAWASTAPVEAVVDFYRYLEVIQDSLPVNTPDLLGFAFEKWDEMTKTEEGRKELAKIFNTCSDIKEEDIQPFSEYVGTAFAGYVQYNSSYWKTNYESSDSRAYHVIKDVVVNYPEFVKTYTKEYGDDCFDASLQNYYNKLKDTRTADQGNDEASARSWVFQTCIAYGYYQAVEPESKVKFGKLNRLQGSIDMCKEVFGISKETLYSAVDHTNVRYGAKKPRVTNVAFVSGTTDPWHTLAITEETEGCYVHLIEKTSHVSDLYSEKEFDIPTLKKVRHEEMRFFDNVLKNIPEK